MALPIGHRNGVPIRRKGGLSKIKNRHGIPFYNPADVYDKHDYLLPNDINIKFTTKGKLTGSGGQYEPSALEGSALMRFLLSGLLTGTASKVIPASSVQMKGETTIHFWQEGTLKKYQRLVGNSWIVFYSKMLVKQLIGQSDIVFAMSGHLSSHMLRGQASITFTASLTSFSIKYGLLYNWYVGVDARNVCSSDFRIPLVADLITLRDYLGGESVAGQHLKEVSTTYWPDITYNDNSVKFNMRGSGYRSSDGGFVTTPSYYGIFWSASGGPLWANSGIVRSSDASFFTYNIPAGVASVKFGCALRPMRDATEDEQLMDDGTACDDYVGNDLKRYPSVKIGTQVWVSCSIAETKYRNGDSIPEVTGNTEWSALTTGALCANDNNWDNVFI